MSLYIAPQNYKGSVAIAICDRCGLKKRYGDLSKDPNNGLLVCDNCKDLYDPWRLPARKTENIALQHPRPDVDLE